MTDPNVKFRTIVADPPWMPTLGASWNSSFADKSRPHRQYPTMALDEIAALEIPSAEQAHLYLWCLAQHVDWGYRVAQAWGFKSVILWTWRKPGVGTGRFLCNTEHILVARRGTRHGNPFGVGGRHTPATRGTCFDWPRGRHSEKPSGFFTLVEALSPAPRLELFARRQRDGWTCWGDELGVILRANHQVSDGRTTASSTELGAPNSVVREVHHQEFAGQAADAAPRPEEK